MTLSPLAYALIGLVAEQAQTGYSLRKTFETTPIRSYSSSPGSIYPALNKLVRNGYLEKRGGLPASKPLYHVTQAGRAILSEWLCRPVSVEDVANGLDTVLLRFAFLKEMEDDAEQTRVFLTSLENGLQTHLIDLNGYLKSSAAMGLSTHGRLAMLHGVSSYRASLDWCREAMKAFSR